MKSSIIMLDYVRCDVSNVVDGYTQVQQQQTKPFQMSDIIIDIKIFVFIGWMIEIWFFFLGRSLSFFLTKEILIVFVSVLDTVKS